MKNKLALLVLVTGIAVTGCTTTKLVETPPGSGHFQQVAETDPRLVKGLGTATGVIESIGAINPWHGLFTLAVGAVAGVAEWTRRRKQAQLDAVITGVEQADNSDVKKAIKDAAVAAKVETGLNDSVKRITGV